MKKTNNTPLAIAMGSTLISGLAMTDAQANTLSEMDANPFKIAELSAGYMQTAKSEKDKVQKMKDGSCGEGKCGSAMMKGAEEKTTEGKCAGNKPMPKSKKSPKNKEGKCGSSM